MLIRLQAKFAGLMLPLRFAFGVVFGLGRRRGFFFHLKIVSSENALDSATKSRGVQAAVGDAFHDFGVATGKTFSEFLRSLTERAGCCCSRAFKEGFSLFASDQVFQRARSKTKCNTPTV